LQFGNLLKSWKNKAGLTHLFRNWNWIPE